MHRRALYGDGFFARSGWTSVQAVPARCVRQTDCSFSGATHAAQPQWGHAITAYMVPRSAGSPMRDDRGVAYDEDLARRIRELVADQPGLTEQKMFGGLAFLIGGNMAVAASGQGGLLVRVDPGQADALVAGSHATPMEMRGRLMPGWLRVDTEHVNTAHDLAAWVERGTSFARSLPAKR
jgi:hypothetical protein